MPERVVHLELHTGDLARAWTFYARLFDWTLENVCSEAGVYMASDMGGGLGGGAVQCGVRPPRWLPYVEVDQIGAMTRRAVRLGGKVMLGPSEGPAGWRSVVAAPAGGEVALWQPKR